jgi:transcriptional regulator with XRE-family HTH domain
MARIGPRTPKRHFLYEWREHRGLTQQQLADRLETNHENISRWENHQRPIGEMAQLALAEALSIEPGDLWRHPDTPSADELLRHASPAVRDQAIAVVRALLLKSA